jgi:hypothetical protein
VVVVDGEVGAGGPVVVLEQGSSEAEGYGYMLRTASSRKNCQLLAA